MNNDDERRRAAASWLKDNADTLNSEGLCDGDWMRYASSFLASIPKQKFVVAKPLQNEEFLRRLEQVIVINKIAGIAKKKRPTHLTVTVDLLNRVKRAYLDTHIAKPVVFSEENVKKAAKFLDDFGSRVGYMAIGGNIPMKEVGTPEEEARAFLLSLGGLKDENSVRDDANVRLLEKIRCKVNGHGRAIPMFCGLCVKKKCKEVVERQRIKIISDYLETRRSELEMYGNLRSIIDFITTEAAHLRLQSNTGTARDKETQERICLTHAVHDGSEHMGCDECVDKTLMSVDDLNNLERNARIGYIKIGDLTKEKTVYAVQEKFNNELAGDPLQRKLFVKSIVQAAIKTATKNNFGRNDECGCNGGKSCHNSCACTCHSERNIIPSEAFKKTWCIGECITGGICRGHRYSPLWLRQKRKKGD